MDAYDLIISRRTVRNFAPDPIDEETLIKLIDAARLAPCGANLQPLRFLAVNDSDLKQQVFSTLKWAAYIAPHGNPPAGREPAAYIIILSDQNVGSKTIQMDVGFAAENLLIAGLCFNVAGCAILSFNPRKIVEIFNLPEHIKPELVLALGRPGEFPEMVDGRDEVKYWRDEEGRHFTPKKPRDQVMFFNKLG